MVKTNNVFYYIHLFCLKKALIFLIYLGDEAEKAFIRLRDKYVRAKKSFKESNKSGTSAKAVRKAREKLDSLAFMQWLDDFIRPRQSTHNDTFDPSFDNEASIGDLSQSFVATQDSSDFENSNPVISSKTLLPTKRKDAQAMPKEATKKKKRIF